MDGQYPCNYLSHSWYKFCHLMFEWVWHCSRCIFSKLMTVGLLFLCYKCFLLTQLVLILKDHKTCIFNTFRFFWGRASISVCSQQNEEMLFIPFGAESLLQILRYLIFFRWTNKRMLFILYGAECPLFESCGIPSLFCGYEMQNHTHQITWKRLQTRVHAERARQR